MTLQVAYPSNDNLFWLRNATNARAGTVVASGTATLTSILDENGEVIGGVTFPLIMVVDDAALGHWVTQLGEDAELEPDKLYTAIIDIDDGTGTVGHFEAPFLALTRTTS